MSSWRKRQKDKKKNTEMLHDVARGSISILLVMVLVPIIAVAGLFVDASRYQLARSEVASAGDLTLNTALANYDHVLKDVYGLFAVSQGDEGELRQRLQTYFTEMITSSVGAESIDEIQGNELLKNIVNIGAGEKTSSLLSMQTGESVLFQGVPGSQLSHAGVLRHQIVEFEKYRAPLNAGLSIIEGMKALKNLKKQMEVTKKSAEVDDAVQDLNKQCKKLWDAIKEYEAIDKKALLEADSIKGEPYVGDQYKDIYKRDVIPVAVERLLLDEHEGKVKLEQDSSQTGYFMEYEVPNVEMKSTFNTKEGSHQVTPNNLTSLSADDLRAAVKHFQRIVQKDSTIEGYRSSGLMYQEITPQMSTQDVLVHITAYEKYMFNVYWLWNVFDAYLTASKKEMEKISEITDDSSTSTTGEITEVEKEDDAQQAFLNEWLPQIEKCLREAYDWKTRLDKGIVSLDGRYAVGTVSASDISKDYNAKSSELVDMKNAIDKCVIEAENLMKYVQKASDKNNELKSSLDNYGTNDSFSSEMKGTYEANKELIDVESFNVIKRHINNLKEHVENAKKYFDYLRIIDTTTVDQLPKFTLYALNSVHIFKEKLKSETRPSGGQTYGDWILETYNENPNTSSEVFVLEIAETYLTKGKYANGAWDHSIEPSLEGDGFYTYLRSTFGMEKQEAKEERDLRNNLNDSGKNIANSALDESNVLNVSSGNISDIIQDSSDSSGASTSFNTSDMSTMTDDDGKGYSSMLGNTASSLGTILTGIEKAIEDARDNLFVMDYATNMFSWNTHVAEFTKEERELPPKTPTGVEINEANNKFYGGEVEYIVYGIDNVKANVLAAKASIFTIRFACNAIFALTDHEINTITLAPALAIQAATAGIVPYKIPQLVMKLALALAESGIDMVLLSKGESVALIKDSESWKMGKQGALDLAKQGLIDISTKAASIVGESAKGAVNSLVDGATNTVNANIDTISSELQTAVNQQSEQVVGGLFDTFSNTVVQAFNNRLSQLSRNANDVAQKIIDDADSAASGYLVQQSSGPVRQAMQSAYEAFKAQAIGGIKSEITEQLTNLENKTQQSSIDAVKSVKNRVTSAIGSRVQDTAETISKDLQNEVTNLGKKVNDTVGGKIDEMTSTVSNSLASSINDFFDDNFGGYTGGSGSGSKSPASSGFASLLKFKYSDYLRVFLLIGMVTNSDNAVTRIGNLITANIRCASSGKLLHEAGSDFSLAKSFTYYEMGADIKLRTMFLALPIITKKMEVEEFSAFYFSYHGALGY